MVACSDFKVEYSLAQEPLPCVVVTLGRNEQGEFPNSEGSSGHNLVSWNSLLNFERSAVVLKG